MLSTARSQRWWARSCLGVAGLSARHRFAHPTEPYPLKTNSARGGKPLLSQETHRRVGVHRLAASKALPVFAAELVELDRIRIRLRAFCDDVHAEVVGERDDRLQDHRPVPAARGADEGLVDLQGVERETLQIGQRGMAGAEIVNRQPD